MNILENRYIKNPDLLVSDIKKSCGGDRKRINGLFSSSFIAYLFFSKEELCPNDTAYNFAKACSLPSSKIEELENKFKEYKDTYVKFKEGKSTYAK